MDEYNVIALMMFSITGYALWVGVKSSIKKARMHKAILEQYRQPSEPYRNPFE